MPAADPALADPALADAVHASGALADPALADAVHASGTLADPALADAVHPTSPLEDLLTGSSAGSKPGGGPGGAGPGGTVLDDRALDDPLLDEATRGAAVLDALAGDGAAGGPVPGDGAPGDTDPAGLDSADDRAPSDESDLVLSGRIIPISLLRSGGQVALTSSSGALPATRAAGEADWLADGIRAVLAWASRRHLGLISACGIFVALAVCAATWFSAGDRTDILRGTVALWGGYLALKAGQRLPAPPPRPGPVPAKRAVAMPGSHAGADARILVHDPEPLASRAAGGPAAATRPASWTDWLAVLGSSLAECGVYAGLAVGAVAERWAGVWPWAVAVVGLIAVRSLISACSTPPGFGERADGAFRQFSVAVLTMPLGGRILVVGIVAPVWGARAALLALADWAIISIAYGLAGRVAPHVMADEHAPHQGAPGRASLLLRLRDDGALARALGNLVRGNLLPLPPAILGLLAVSALGVLGLHGLPTVLMIGPVIVLLLAAPGSSHPHAGRLDWLVPALLLGSQVLYLDAIGTGAGVPGPVIFALVAALLVHYADLAFPDRPVLLAKPRHPGEARGERGTGLGWEGRLLIAGLAAALGIATFAYLALAAYLAALIGINVLTSSVARAEDHNM